MNRKEFLKSLPLAAGLAVAAPSILKASSLPDRSYQPTAGCAPTPMPPDTRTNDELWEDDMKGQVRRFQERVEWLKANSPSYKYIDGFERAIYPRIKALVAEKGWTLTETIRDGITTFEVEGILFRLY